MKLNESQIINALNDAAEWVVCVVCNLDNQLDPNTS